MPKLERADSKVKTCGCRIEYIGAGDSEIIYCIMHEKAEDMFKLLKLFLAFDTNALLYSRNIIDEIESSNE